MKRLEYIKKNTLQWNEFTPPKLEKENQVLVKPLVVSRCDLDLPIIRGETLFKPSFPLGHEFVAEIIEISSDLENLFSVGQRVAVSFQISCGECLSCSSGTSKSCSSVPHTSGYGLGSGAKEFGGALSDLLLVPFAKQMLLPIKNSTNLISIASLNDNLIEAWKLSGMRLKQNPKQSVLVLGGKASSIGLFTVALSKHLGAFKILYLDNDKARLEIAKKLGAEVEEIDFINPKISKRNQNRFSIIAECTGNEEGFLYGLRSIEVEGYFSSASIYWTNKLPIPYLELYNFGATIYMGRVNSVEWMPKLLYEIEEKNFDPSQVITKIASWDDAKDAYLEEQTKLIISRI
jgi:threonine dehydrogenase-like Zn-dependent dehydrogenase